MSVVKHDGQWKWRGVWHGRRTIDDGIAKENVGKKCLTTQCYAFFSLQLIFVFAKSNSQVPDFVRFLVARWDIYRSKFFINGRALDCNTIRIYEVVRWTVYPNLANSMHIHCSQYIHIYGSDDPERIIKYFMYYCNRSIRQMLMDQLNWPMPCGRLSVLLHASLFFNASNYTKSLITFRLQSAILYLLVVLFPFT